MIYLRLDTTEIEVRRKRVEYVLTHQEEHLDRFLTVTEQLVRDRS